MNTDAIIPFETADFDTVKVVTSYSEFKTALEDSTTIAIYLDTDITVALGGITINPAKASLIIDGTSPSDGTVHSITDCNSLYQYDAITLRINSALKSITLRNITVYGKNYFGTISVYGAVTNATVKYENIKYYGPQLTYNLNGTAHYKDSYIEIGKFNGISPSEQLAEATNVIFEGNTIVTQTDAQAYEIIHSLYPGSVEVSQNANVTINTYSDSGFIYAALSTNFIIHENAAFNYYGPRRFWEGIPFKNVTVKPYARLYIEITIGLTTNMLFRVDGTLNVEPESELILINRGTSSSFAAINMNAGSANFRNPKRVVLYSPGYRPLYYGVSESLLIDAQQVRYWTSATAFDLAGKIDDIPKYHWNKLDDSNIEISGRISLGVTGNFSSFESNYNQEDTTGDAEINATTFSQANARVLAFGRLPITAEYVHISEESSEIIGSSEPGASIEITYMNENNTIVNLKVAADSGGRYIIPLNYVIDDGTIITAKSNRMFLTSEITFIASNDMFKLSISSENIEFETTYLSYETKLVKRNNPDWGIVITDNRGEGSTWSLSALLITPLSYADEYNSYVLDNALVFIDDAGNVNTLTTDYETPIFSHTTTSDIDVIDIAWEENKGLLARIEPNAAQIDIPYKGAIMWLLKDVP